MNIKEHLSNYSKNLTINDICQNDMSEYNYFKEFIINHYSLEHIKIYNYLKYVKIIRQKILYDTNGLYDTYLQRIDNIIKREQDAFAAQSRKKVEAPAAPPPATPPAHLRK